MLSITTEPRISNDPAEQILSAIKERAGDILASTTDTVDKTGAMSQRLLSPVALGDSADPNRISEIYGIYELACKTVGFIPYDTPNSTVIKILPTERGGTAVRAVSDYPFPVYPEVTPQGGQHAWGLFLRKVRYSNLSVANSVSIRWIPVTKDGLCAENEPADFCLNSEGKVVKIEGLTAFSFNDFRPLLEEKIRVAIAATGINVDKSTRFKRILYRLQQIADGDLQNRIVNRIPVLQLVFERRPYYELLAKKLYAEFDPKLTLITVDGQIRYSIVSPRIRFSVTKDGHSEDEFYYLCLVSCPDQSSVSLKFVKETAFLGKVLDHATAKF